MPNTDHLKSARQMIDDLINDDPDASKQSFHDFLKAKTIARLNPDMVQDEEVEDEDEDDDTDVEIDIEDDDTEVEVDDDTEVDDK